MQGSLGEKIGEGAYSDVHAWAPGQVVKLFKAGFSRRASWWEARMTRAVFAAGAPAPEVFDEVTLEGRFGVVLQRLDGPTLLQLSRSGAMTPEQTGAILAALAISVHKIAPPPDVLSLRDTMAGSLRALRHASGADRHWHPQLDRAPAAGGQTVPWRPSPRQRDHDGRWSEIIDWGGATRAPVGLDLACCHVLLCDLAPDSVADPERPRAVNAATQSEYARLAGMSQAALTAAMGPYLPIVYVRVLLGPAGSPALRERLTQRVEAALRSED